MKKLLSLLAFIPLVVFALGDAPWSQVATEYRAASAIVTDVCDFDGSNCLSFSMGGGTFENITVTDTATINTLVIDGAAVGNIQANDHWYSNDGDDEGIRVDDAGMVGIGTDSPSNKLEIMANEVGGGLFVHGSSNPVIILQDDNGGNVSMAAFNTNAVIQNTYSSGTMQIGAKQGLSLSGSGVTNEDVYIDNVGKVGIGETTPLSKLHINGGVGTLATGLSFGDGDTGFFESTDDSLKMEIGGVPQWFMQAGLFRGTSDGTFEIKTKEAVSSTNPVFTIRGDDDTGVGKADMDQLSLIAGGKEIARASENTTEQFIINPQGDLTGTAAAPSLAFGDGDTGFYEGSDDILDFSIAGAAQHRMQGNIFKGASNTSYRFSNSTASDVTPNISPNNGDVDTGIGSAGMDQLSLIVGGVEGIRITEDTGAIGINMEGSIFGLEQSTSQSSVAGYGQTWVKDSVPNELMFTDDAGTDINISDGATTAFQNQFIFGTLLNNGFFEAHEFEVLEDSGTIYTEIWSSANSYAGGTTYNRGNQTIYSNMRYFSLVDSNTGNQPDISPSEWELIAAADFNLHGFIEGSNRIYSLDTTTGAGVSGHARVALTAGTDAVPVRNWIFAEMNGSLELTLSASVTEPVGPVIILGYADIGSVSTTDTQGPTNQQRFTNGLYREDIFEGQMQAIRDKARHRVTYETGVTPSLAISVNGGAIDDVVVTTTAGVTHQLWEQAFDAQAGTPTFYVLNHPTNPITQQYTDLNELDVDADGDSLRDNTDRYALRIWGNQTSGTNNMDALYVTLPTCDYATDTGALLDSSVCDTTLIDEFYINTFFNIGRVVLRYQTADSGTLTNLVGGTDLQDKRGEVIGAVGGSGGGVSSQTEFSTAEFELHDSTDVTKQITWDAAGISTANNRVITMADRDLDLADPVFDTVGIGGTATTDLDVFVTNGNSRVFGQGTATQGLFHIRSSQTNDSFMSFAEDNVADLGGIGFDAGSTAMDFIVGGTLSGGTTQLSIDTTGIVMNDNLEVNGGIGYNSIPTVTYNSGTTTADWSTANTQIMTFGAGDIATLAFTDPTAVGQTIKLKLIQDGTGGRTVTAWDADIQWSGGGTAPTLSSDPDLEDWITCIYLGSGYDCAASLDFQ